MPTVTFDDWVEAVFAHPTSEPEWYWDKDFDEYWDALGLSDALTVEYMTRLFLDPSQLKRYSLGQVAQAIWFLIGSPAGRSSMPSRSANDLRKRKTERFLVIGKGICWPVERTAILPR